MKDVILIGLGEFGERTIELFNEIKKKNNNTSYKIIYTHINNAQYL